MRNSGVLIVFPIIASCFNSSLEPPRQRPADFSDLSVEGSQETPPFITFIVEALRRSQPKIINLWRKDYLHPHHTFTNIADLFLHSFDLAVLEMNISRCDISLPVFDEKDGTWTEKSTTQFHTISKIIKQRQPFGLLFSPPIFVREQSVGSEYTFIKMRLIEYEHAHILDAKGSLRNRYCYSMGLIPYKIDYHRLNDRQTQLRWSEYRKLAIQNQWKNQIFRREGPGTFGVYMEMIKIPTTGTKPQLQRKNCLVRRKPSRVTC